jgi:TonB family protein
MRLSLASSALAAAFVLAPVAAGHAPAYCQDFSITNPEELAIPGHPNLIRELQAWWDAHAYYPRHASNNDEGGTVKLHLVIHPNGEIWMVDVVGSSGSSSLDTAGATAFRGGVLRPFPEGEPQAEIDISLHYVLAHRHDQPVPAGYTPAPSRSPFTITNDPVKSPILETMVQRICTGSMTRGGIPNRPAFGTHSWAQAIFFHRPDGTPWVKFWDHGHQSLAPVTQVGKLVTWTSERKGSIKGGPYWLQYTVWPDGDNHISGAIGTRRISASGVPYNANLAGDYFDLTCETEVQPRLHGMILLQNGIPVRFFHLWIFQPVLIRPDGPSTMRAPLIRKRNTRCGCRSLHLRLPRLSFWRRQPPARHPRIARTSA